MSKKSTSQIDRASFLESFGLSRLWMGRNVARGSRLELLLPLGTDSIRVGVLLRETAAPGLEYVFRYTPEFKHREDLPPVPDFPDKQKEYRASRLWPFFEQRIPPIQRADVQRILHEKRLTPESDPFVLLEALGGETVSNPYRLVPAGARAA